MKNQPHLRLRIISILLIPMMLFASVGYAVDFHYCQGNLKSFSFAGKAASCHNAVADKSVKTCPFHSADQLANSGISLEKTACCQNETLQFHSDIDQNLNTSQVSPEHQDVPSVFIISHTDAYKSSSIIHKKLKFLCYKPPSIVADIPVLIQSFLL
jgi:hypothetical protein